jgi:multiple sugar transport system substrate-binding protein
MTSGYRGLTWDHPRGREGLRAAAADAARNSGLAIQWDVHSLEGFESAPIAELAERYDLIVLDHPHLGEALATASLQPVDALFGEADIARLAESSVGPSLESYRMGGHVWALPLDAAAQVAVRRPDLVPEAPISWDDVLTLSRSGGVALSVAGPHAFLSFCSLVVGMGELPNDGEAGDFVSEATGIRALELLTELAGRAPAGSDALNPIAMLEAMASGNDIGYCPLIYGYVNYSAPASGSSLLFSDAPLIVGRQRRGSTIGGTGIAVTARCRPSAQLLEHLRWLLSPEAQRDYIPAHAGQPSARSAWHDGAVNRASQNFYASTLETLEQAWVRPRYAGYIGFQSAASAVLRRALAERQREGATLTELNRLYAKSLPTTTTAAAGRTAPSRGSADD